MRKAIKNYEGFYEVDELGNVFSLDRFDGWINRKGKKLKPDWNSAGYGRVTLSKSGKTKRFFIHRLVYEAYYGEIPKDLQVHHIDENKENNSIQNLELVTQRENNHLSRDSLGYKLYQEDVDEIRASNLTTKEISEKYGISLRHALRILKNERWIS